MKGVREPRERRLVALGGAHVLLAVGLGAALSGRAGFLWHLGLHAALFVPLALVLAPALSGRGSPGRRALGIVLGAWLLGRTALLLTPPVLSDDLYRMVWEGQVVLAGKDPWAHPPDHPELRTLAAEFPELRERVGYWKLPAIYPPAAQLFAAGVGRISARPVALKGALLVAEAALLAALLALLRGRGLDPRLLAAWAWNPLPLTEIAGSGHGDIVAIALLALALLAAERGRNRAGAALAALSGMAKIAGFALLPFLLRAAAGARERAALLAAAAGAAALPLVPFLGPERLADGLGTRFAEFGASLGFYAQHWRFNDALFGPLAAVLGAAARPAVLAVLLLAAGVLVARRTPSSLALAILGGSAFLLSPAAHPWYLLWPLALLLLHPERRELLAAGLTLSLTVALGYHAFWNTPPGAGWSLPGWVRLAEYLPPLLAAAAARRCYRGSASSRRNREIASAAA